MYRKSETAALQRDVEGTEIPGGDKWVLGRGSAVTVIESLGGSYSVLTEQGFMVRVDGKDSDALGERYVKAQAEPKPQAPEGPFEESQVWDQLRTVYDPEIPVNIVDLGLVYKCESKPLPDGGYRVDVQMTMTAPGCGMGGVLKEDIRHKVLGLSGVKESDVEVVWEPPWDPSRMSDAARLQLGWMCPDSAEALTSAGRDRTTRRRSVVVFVAKMGDRLFAHHPAQGVLQLHQLDEEIVLRVEAFRGHRALEVEAEPLLDSLQAPAPRPAHPQSETEHH